VITLKISLKITIIFGIVLVIFIIFLWILTGKWMADGQKPLADGTKDYAIVLGAKVNGETPSLSLRYRLEATLKYANQYPHVKLVLSGGQGSDEYISEAEAMRRYLVENGISEERLLLESKSTSTYENILLSKELLPSSVQSVTIITSDYHLARARRIASALDLQSDAVHAKTPKIVELKSRVRERAALLKNFLVGK
jgi:uncharacterized SAM-binding protein YcdF (DUF218 family)